MSYGPERLVTKHPPLSVLPNLVTGALSTARPNLFPGRLTHSAVSDRSRFRLKSACVNPVLFPQIAPIAGLPKFLNLAISCH